MRRSREQIYNIYLEYLAIDKSLSNAEIARTIGVSGDIICKWNKGIVPPPAANPKPPGYYANKYAEAKSPTIVLTIVNNVPLKEQIIILLKDGHSVSDIAIDLDLTPKSVSIVKCHAGLDNRIKAEDNNSDMSFLDIAVSLDMDESEVYTAYRSGLSKIFDLIGDIGGLEQYLEDNIPDEFKNVGNACSKHYSLMV